MARSDGPKRISLEEFVLSRESDFSSDLVKLAESQAIYIAHAVPAIAYRVMPRIADTPFAAQIPFRNLSHAFMRLTYPLHVRSASHMAFTVQLDRDEPYRVSFGEPHEAVSSFVSTQPIEGRMSWVEPVYELIADPYEK